jgi:hypothetical protein
MLVAQAPPERLIIGGESFTVGMAQEEVMKKLEKCCSPSRSADPKSFFIFDKNRSEILGAVWFRQGKLERVRGEGPYSQDPAAISFATSLFRLLSACEPSGAATIVLQTDAREASNASTKVVTFVFRNGRSIELEIVAPDDPQKLRNQVSLSEVVEK